MCNNKFRYHATLSVLLSCGAQMLSQVWKFGKAENRRDATSPLQLFSQTMAANTPAQVEPLDEDDGTLRHPRQLQHLQVINYPS